MTSLRSCAALAALLAPLALSAQATKASSTTTSGKLSVGFGGTLLEGNKAAFQSHSQSKKDGFGGIEEFTLLNEGDGYVFKTDLKIMLGDEDYLARLNYTRDERFYVDAGYRSYKVFYNGAGAYFPGRNLRFQLYDEAMGVDRSKLWVEAGTLFTDKPNFKVRYELQRREGQKGSTHHSDSNLVGAPYGTRSITPAFLDLDEVRSILSAQVGMDMEKTSWKIAGRYETNELDNKRNVRRRAFEPTADRFVTTRDESSNDVYVGNGYIEHVFSEKLRMSTGVLVTKIDGMIEGSRIYGQSYDPVLDPAYIRRQQRDEGYVDLEGHADIKQTVANLNVVYQPTKNLMIRPALRFEDMTTETMGHFMETNVGSGPAFAFVKEEVEGESEKDWQETTASLEARYTGLANWTFAVKGEMADAEGVLEEERILHTGVLTVDRDTEITREVQKVAATANWYARPGLTVAFQTYYKVRTNDYDAIRDNTTSSADRYPAYITDQDFETTDFNVRVNFRPVGTLNLVSRYDYQLSTITSQEAGLAKVESSELTTHVFSQTATFNPVPRMFVSAGVNFVYDQLATPAYRFIRNSDNNYVSGTLGVGYALDDKSDLFLDYAYFSSEGNYADLSSITQPYGADSNRATAALTWNRRVTENLNVVAKYVYSENEDLLSGGWNDYTAHTLYTKLEFSF
jgi:hypothetical protein